MRITQTINHGKTRWRVNIQRDGYRKRLFFETGEAALAFAQAASGPVRFGKPAFGKDFGDTRRHGWQHVSQPLRRLGF